jgi:hypothetical protein
MSWYRLAKDYVNTYNQNALTQYYQAQDRAKFTNSPDIPDTNKNNPEDNIGNFVYQSLQIVTTNIPSESEGVVLSLIQNKNFRNNFELRIGSN